MPSINPGPAVTSNANSEAVLTPVNNISATNPAQGANALRLLGSARGVILSGVGDAALIQIINASSWLPATMVTSNGLLNGVSGSIATASIGLFTGPGGTGTAIKAAGVLASNTAQTAVGVVATSVLAVSQTVTAVFVNVAVALAGATVDIFLYGYDHRKSNVNLMSVMGAAFGPPFFWEKNLCQGLPMWCAVTCNTCR